MLGAIAAYRMIPDTSPDFFKAKAALQPLLPKVDKLVSKLFGHVDEMLSDGQAARAIAVLTAMQKQLPSDRRGADLDKRLGQAKDKLAALRAEHEDKLNRGRERTRAGDPREAFRLFARAEDIAEDNEFPWTLTEEQLYEQARIDLPAPAQRVAAVHEQEPRRKRRRGNTEATELISGGEDTFVSQEQELVRLKNVRDLVEKARDYKKRGMTYEAIVTLEEARAKDPESGAVKLGLESLEDDRARLVDGYLEVADRYFAKQELESAVPYFRRVLRLEPDNLRAKEAIHMYDNLEKIKRERSSSN